MSASAISSSKTPAVDPAGGGGLVCVGAIVGVHGVRGQLKIKSFTADPAAIVGYGPLYDASGCKRFVLHLVSATKDGWLAKLEGVTDRTAAETLRGVRLYIPRAALPPVEDEDEFYHTDLIGLTAQALDGQSLGTVAALHVFGGGDVVEVRRMDGSTLLVPFTRAAVPVVDIPGRRLVIDPPVEVAGDEPPAGAPPAEAQDEES
ncbi:Ribosome maturation factor RimM [uncultured Gammaproteobacteria bacterium]